jgi:predicted GIY-YIG superfamily endonuclease
MVKGHKIGAVKRAILNHIHPKNNRSDFYVRYSNWYIGITNNVKIRKAQHQKNKNIAALHFKAWNTDTKKNAIEIEKHFHALGMRDKASIGGAKDSTTYVYIFKVKTNIADDVAYLFGIIN